MKAIKTCKALVAKLMVLAVVFTTVLAMYQPMTAEAANETLLNTYGRTYGYSGTCINLYQLRNATTLNQIKKHYNSITLENEMKPDALLGSYCKTMSVAQAKAQGYYIPSNYKESVVPQINFSTVDEVMKICYQNGLKMRAHTLVWHSQTPTWFFRNNYSGNGGFVNSSVMDARLEMYVKTVINHVYSSQYGSVVYAWDVVNEIQHASNSGWEAVYGNNRKQATYVKKAFEYAYSALSSFGLNGKVKLFSNDFNTYMCVNDEIALINYVNSSKKICDGIGMQSHLGTGYPSPDYYMSALNSFLKAGFEVQITELDITNKGDQDMANYCTKLFDGINSAKKNGAKISGITWWGLSDQVTWINNSKPLLFSSPDVPKSPYYAVINSFTKTFGNNAPAAGGTDTNPSTQPSGGQSTVNTGATTKINDGWYYIKNTGSQKYLSVASNTGKDAQNVEISTGTGMAGQKWKVTNTSDGYMTLTSATGNFSLDIASAKNEDGTNVQIYTSHSGDAQKFQAKATSQNNVVTIVTKASNGTKALDVYNFGTSDGTNVCQWSFGGKENQTWVFEAVQNQSQQTQPTQPSNPQPTQPATTGKVADGWYYIKGVASQKYLQVAGNTGKNVQNVEIGTKTGADGQLWKVTNTSDGYFTLTSKLGNFGLDIANGTADNGANAQIYASHSGDAQQFTVKSTSQNGAYAIATKCSNGEKVLDVEGKKTTDGANVCQYANNGQTNQMWIFEAATVTEQTQPTTQPTEQTQPTVQPAAGKLGVSYTISNWGSGYQVSFKVENKSGARVNSWTVTVPKSEINITASWNVTIKESGNNYVITPVSWNSTIENGNSVEFGVQGSGSIGTTLSATVK